MGRFAGIIKNDYAAAPGISVTMFVQGCPIHCFNCQNLSLLDPSGGREATEDTYKYIVSLLTANGITRNFVVQGGEPLADYNIDTTYSAIKYVKEQLPDTKVYVYTGYSLNQLDQLCVNIVGYEDKLKYILANLEWIKIGPYIEYKRDITLRYRGSTNQQIIRCPLTLDGKIDIIDVDNDEEYLGLGENNNG